MAAPAFAYWVLAREARALLTRLDRIKPLVLLETMVPAAGIATDAMQATEHYLAKGRRMLRARGHAYIRWLEAGANRASPAVAHRRYALLRLELNRILTQFDLFSDALTQRSEIETGVWLAGLDAAARDALILADYYEAPPLLCYLDRGAGAAIRRARTRLPGGGSNPVAIIRVPRERMVGAGVAASLVHEVGHQASELLGLPSSLRPVLRVLQSGRAGAVWVWWERWISEILADFWAVAKLGLVATLGLMGVVSLPRPFVFRVSMDDPHPIPWIRVRLSCALGQALYPHPQWARLSALWASFYPRDGLDPPRLRLLADLEDSIPAMAGVLVGHRPPSLRGESLQEVVAKRERRPERLDELFLRWRAYPDLIVRAPPTLALAVIGQARARGRISPEQESATLSNLLTHWAARSVLVPAPVLPRRPTLVLDEFRRH